MKWDKAEAYMLFFCTLVKRLAAVVWLPKAGKLPGTVRLPTVVLLLAAVLLTGCGERKIVVERQGTVLSLDEAAAQADTNSPNVPADETAAVLVSIEQATDELMAEKATSEEPLNETGGKLEESRGEKDKDPKKPANADTDKAPEEPVHEQTMFVHVCGAVALPGVYELPADARIYLAVEAAGGFLESADQEWCNQAQPLSDGDSLRIYTVDETKNLAEEGISPQEDHFGITASLDRFGSTDEAAGSAAQSAGSWGTAVNGAANVAGASGVNGAAGVAGASGINDLSSAGDASASDGRINLNTADAQQLMQIPGIGSARAADIISYRTAHGSFTSVEELLEVSGIGQGIFEKIKNYVTVF